MAEVAEGTKVSAFAVFRNRNFTLLWSGQLVSTIGNALTSLAASILVYRLTGSALERRPDADGHRRSHFGRGPHRRRLCRPLR